jgi:DNA-binding MurR/RpiR family transcriptional regulator
MAAATDPSAAGILPPRDFESLRAYILARQGAMPRRLLEVAAFAVDHPGEMAFGTAAGIARTIGVQPSTLVRFAQSLGYSGFSQLQGLFRDHMRGHWPDYGDRLKGLRAAGPPEGLLEGFARASIQSIERLTATLPPERIAAAIALLAGAETIYLVAARRAYPVAMVLNYTFGRLGMKRALVDHAGLMGPETLAFAGPRDVLLAISFTPYTAATVDLATGAAARGVPLVSITDSAFSPLAQHSAVWLEVVETSHISFRSLAATMTLAMTLAAGAAELRAEQTG